MRPDSAVPKSISARTFCGFPFCPSRPNSTESNSLGSCAAANCKAAHDSAYCHGWQRQQLSARRSREATKASGNPLVEHPAPANDASLRIPSAPCFDWNAKLWTTRGDTGISDNPGTSYGQYDQESET